MPNSPDQKIMKPYLLRLLREHRRLNRLIDTTKSIGSGERLKAMKRLRLRLKDKIAVLQRHYYGRGLTG